jgi:mono/diheme cytochrome c family protein
MKRICISLVLGAVTYFACQGMLAPIYAAGPTTSLTPGGAQLSASSGGEAAATADGARLYSQHCAVCHGAQRQGIPPAFPSLVGVGQRMTDKQIAALLARGRGSMPAFPDFHHEEVTALVRYLKTSNLATSANESPAKASGAGDHPEGTRAGADSSGVATGGDRLFQQNCAFCHGRDAQGGESGPNLTRSRLVRSDLNGDKITEVVRNGRPEKKMPAFNFSGDEMRGLIAFIHSQVAEAAAQPGGRKGVDDADLQTGNVAEGKRYFEGAGTCSSCHSATGDLAGVATRYQGLQLEEQMLYPTDAKNRMTVTLPTGQKIHGVVAHMDEFTVAIRDANGNYRSWPTGKITYALDSPVHAHADLFSKYTDDDIHNLMAYIQTLR